MPEGTNTAFTRTNVGPIPFEVTNLESAAHFVVDCAKSHRAVPIRLANAYCVAEADSHPDYANLFHDGGYNFPDGSPVAWTMQRTTRSQPRPGRVRGPSLFARVISLGEDEKIGHFFLGTTDHTLNLLQQSVSNQFPGAVIAGSYAPDFGPLTQEFYDRAIEEIERSSPDIVWVAMGSPKQDFAAAELARRTNLTCIGIGAAFDFMAGTQREAPNWMQRNGLEWGFRLITEPRRLWKRYLIGNFRFLYAVLKCQLQSSKK